MGHVARASLENGMLFYIKTKEVDEVIVTVNKEKQIFGSWKAAEQWVDNEIKRSNTRERE